MGIDIVQRDGDVNKELLPALRPFDVIQLFINQLITKEEAREMLRLPRRDKEAE